MNGYEERIMSELKVVVAERAAAAGTAAEAPAAARRRPGRRIGLGLAVVAAAAGAAVALPIVTGGGEARANAVELRRDGAVAVHVREFSHPERVERKLRGFGIPAKVQFLPSGKKCRPGRAHWIYDGSADRVFGTIPKELNESATLIYPKRLKPGQTVVLDVWALLGKDGEMRTSVLNEKVAQGRVGACVVVPGGPEVHENWAGDGPNTVEDPND
ncbi:hypothetical protein [Actinomadura sp. NPDC048394]|jgi:hypothetical protein|uniref:hypothetical protein n=1 Tax=Actinomadura sp. NPDC048394 TaxID=3158223 RepID=UPI0033ED4D37